MRLSLLPLSLAWLVQAAPLTDSQQLAKRDSAIAARWAQSSVLLSPDTSPLWVVVSGKPYVAGQTLNSNPSDSSTLTLDLSQDIDDLTNAPWNITTGGPLTAYSCTLALSSTSALLFGGDATGDYSVPIQTANDSAWSLTVADKGATVDWDRDESGWMNEPMRRQMSYAWSATNGSLARAWIYGGIKSDGSNLGFSELWEAQFDVDGEDAVAPASEWTKFAGAGGPGEIFDGTAVVVPSSTAGALPSVYLIGGVQLVYNIPSLVNLSTIWVFTPGATLASGSWSTVEVKGTVPTARRGATALLLPNGKIWIQGGRDLDGTTAYADGAALDLKKGTWAATSSASAGAWGQSAAVVGQNVVMAFGYAVNGPASSELLVYNPSKDSWASSYSPNYVKTITAISGSTGSGSGSSALGGSSAAGGVVGGVFTPASIFIPATIYTTSNAAGTTSTVSVAATTVAASAVSTVTDSAGSTASVAVNLGKSTVTVAASAISTAVVYQTLGGATSVIVQDATSTATLVAGVTVTSAVAQAIQSTTVVAVVTSTATLTDSLGSPTATSTSIASVTSVIPVSTATGAAAASASASASSASASSAAAKSSTTAKAKSSTSAAWVAPGTAGIAASSTTAADSQSTSTSAAKASAAAQQRKTTAIAATCSVLGALLLAIGAIVVLRRRRSSHYDQDGHYRGGGGGWGNLAEKSPGSLMAEHNNMEGSFAVGGVIGPSRVRAMQGRREDMLLDEGSEVSFAAGSPYSNRSRWEQIQAQEEEEGSWVGDLGGLGKRGGLGVWEGYAGGNETAASKMSFLGGVLGGFVGGSPVPEVEEEQMYAGGSDPYGGVEEEEPTRWVGGAARKEVCELTPITEGYEDEEGASSVGHSEEYTADENLARTGLLAEQRATSSLDSHAQSSYRPGTSSTSHTTPTREVTPTRTTTPLYGSSFSPSPTKMTASQALPSQFSRSGSTSSLAQHLLSRKDTAASSVKSSGGGLWALLRGSTSNNGSAVGGWGNESVVSGTAKEEIRDPTPAPGLGSLGASARWRMKLTSADAEDEKDPFLDGGYPVPTMDEHGRISDMVLNRARAAGHTDYPTHGSDSSAGGKTDISVATTTRLEEQGRYMDVVMVEREGSVATARSAIEDQHTPRLNGAAGQWDGTDVASVYSQDSSTDESSATRPSLDSARNASIHQARVVSPRLLGPRPLPAPPSRQVPSTAGQVGVKGMVRTFEQQRMEYKDWLQVPSQAAQKRGRDQAGGVLDVVEDEGRGRGEGKKKVVQVGMRRKPVLYVANP